jgi:hypothetical protein
MCCELTTAHIRHQNLSNPYPIAYQESAVGKAVASVVAEVVGI